MGQCFLIALYMLKAKLVSHIEDYFITILHISGARRTTTHKIKTVFDCWATELHVMWVFVCMCMKTQRSVVACLCIISSLLKYCILFLWHYYLRNLDRRWSLSVLRRK